MFYKYILHHLIFFVNANIFVRSAHTNKNKERSYYDIQKIGKKKAAYYFWNNRRSSCGCRLYEYKKPRERNDVFSSLQD